MIVKRNCFILPAAIRQWMTARFLWLPVATSFLVMGCYSKRKNDKIIFHYNEQTGIASLDPAFAKNQSTMWPAHQLFNTLVETDDSLHIVPSLAKKWTVSDDRLTFTFYLRDDVFFHDDPCFTNSKGRKMVATD